MESSPLDAPTESNTQQPVEFSPADRIKQLNQIDKEITSLLTTASAAITTLSSPKPSQSTFRTQSAQYHSSVHSIISALKRQIYALEQADIPLPAVLTSPAGSAPPAAGSGSASGLDIGALSGRSDSVGRKMDQELWKKAREMVEAKKLEEGEKLDLRIDVEIRDTV
ncbi:hypothetical protein TWF106_010512 [Orbilia oligospora]|uniref:Mediator of RNA polymerase II transcription subunit 11 n=1 Tax=Orbilia oligospora TaxID=2813651 RepID=A0A6G1M769_ORBOL|nr:hypothetical protein TWF788_009574 [Orbilia oligospora]KAF3209318.1 hypothetical protein TWF679_007466 [Orbilia oligospora]KAF3210634.1 hypothetical protein TWF106_010512 [Orbilia oligospora]KAF3231100.1 hypothetical protein TWF191_007821 [Orbilia oligospora]KAF3247899.1 hypothetical protein TWF192_006389 [Orbilia oligospora]